MQVVLSLSAGGTERLVIDMCKRLRDDLKLIVCCLDDAGDWAEELRQQGIEVVALGREPGFQPGIGRRIAQLAAERGVRVLHCHQYSPFVYGRLAQLWSPRLKLIYTEHGRPNDAPPSLKRRLVNPLLSRFDGPVVAVSYELREFMVASNFGTSRVGVIHNGIDTGPVPTGADRRRARSLLAIDDDTLVIATVARLDPVKDLHSLLEAFALARQSLPAARLLVVGDGPERSALESRAAQPDLAGSIRFLGMRPDVKALLPCADLYVNSSISEGISLTILEAMASGVPVVATAVGGTPEVLDEGAGVLVPARHSQRLADALLRLAAAPAARAQLAGHGRRRVESLFTIQRMVAEYARMYHCLLESN
jgi:glycosyltransferase involved in cell wall biosynthesis